MQEEAAELISDDSATPDMKSDIWSLGATILQFLFDQSCWDMHSLTKQFNVTLPQRALKEVEARKDFIFKSILQNIEQFSIS